MNNNYELKNILLSMSNLNVPEVGFGVNQLIVSEKDKNLLNQD